MARHDMRGRRRYREVKARALRALSHRHVDVRVKAQRRRVLEQTFSAELFQQLGALQARVGQVDNQDRFLR
jgi:hypothetical protein